VGEALDELGIGETIPEGISRVTAGGHSDVRATGSDRVF